MRKCVVVCFFLLLTACQLQGLTRAPRESVATHVGVEGVVMKFIENAPPQEVFVGNLFEVGVLLENKGAFDVEDGVVVFGLPVDVLSSEMLVSDVFRLRGRHQFVPVGESRRVVMSARTREIGEERLPTVVVATGCYKYATKTSQVVCLSPESVLQKGGGVCSQRDVFLAGGQGAPVAVTQIEKPVLTLLDRDRVKPTLLIHVRNVGRGVVVDKNRFDELCSREKKADEKEWVNVVEVQARMLDKKLSCSPRVLKLADDAVVACTLEEGLLKSIGNLEALVEISIEYGYSEQVTKQLVVKKII